MLKTLEEVRSLITRPSNLRVHMAAHVERLSSHLDDVSLVNVWINEFIPPAITSTTDRYISSSHGYTVTVQALVVVSQLSLSLIHI